MWLQLDIVSQGNTFCNVHLLSLLIINPPIDMDRTVTMCRNPLYYITFPGSKVSQNDCRTWNKSYKYKNTLCYGWNRNWKCCNDFLFKKCYAEYICAHAQLFLNLMVYYHIYNNKKCLPFKPVLSKLNQVQSLYMIFISVLILHSNLRLFLSLLCGPNTVIT
jgi:hypothetical protein